VLTLNALAYASPPDPVWIPAYYDDADYDDVVAMLTDLGKVVQPTAPPVDLIPRFIDRSSIRPVVVGMSEVRAALARRLRSAPSAPSSA
jgi:hypothetical protein